MDPEADLRFMRLALRLAKRGLGRTSPNPMVGAVIVRAGKILGQGWHHRAGDPHAEIEAFCDAVQRGHAVRGATLYVTLEPCSTFGRTPPCVEAILSNKIKRVVVAATDPNPAHAGTAFKILRKAGLRVDTGLLDQEAAELNAAFNHWIVNRTPLVTVKAAMTLDGKIATKTGASQWITSERSRAYAMKIRLAHDAILAGVNTVLTDNPSFTVRKANRVTKIPRRIVLDPKGRIDLRCKLLRNEFAPLTTIILSETASPKAERAIAESGATVWRVPLREGSLDLHFILHRLGAENVTSLLVEGGGETLFTFFKQQAAHRVLFFYAPKIFGGRDARTGVAGTGFENAGVAPRLSNGVWRTLGSDLLFRADVTHTP